MSIICIDSETEAYTECPTATQSRIIINGIDHDTANTLDINIPSEMERNYTNTGNTVYVNISGYNTDDEYISGVIDQMHMTPTTEDFGNLINGLQAFIPYVMIGLLLSFFILLVKKVFK